MLKRDKVAWCAKLRLDSSSFLLFLFIKLSQLKSDPYFYSCASTIFSEMLKDKGFYLERK